jgi:preprotein translocase subunit SecD
MNQLKLMLKNWRISLLLISVILALIMISPAPGNDGVVIRSVVTNSSAANAGIVNPQPNSAPLSYEHIIAINNEPIESVEDYVAATSNLSANQTLRLSTDKGTYTIKVIGNDTDIGVRVSPASKSNIRKGLDLVGGSRVLLKPEEAISAEDLDTLMESLTQRMNVYGLSDVVVRDATDLSGEKFITVEIAGVTEEEVREVIVSQGKFEAKIANQTVFIGGKRDITYVCRTAECSGLNPNQACGQLQGGGYACNFFFAISLSADAASRQAEATKDLDVLSQNGERFLSSTLDLYLDDKLVDSLSIGADLKGQAQTQIQISGGGSGATRQEAMDDTLKSMKRLQTIIITGSLPVKLSIVKLDTISPVLGEKFMENVILVGIAAFIAVAAVIGIRYRSLKIALPMVLILICEIILLLGFAAFVGWNLDLAAMAGIIITIGTAVNHLTIIVDETMNTETSYLDWKRRLKNAMFIIVGSYLTIAAGMLPLWFAGAGLLKGFAFTTLVGVSFGVFITRPAYAALLKILMKA